MTTTQLKKVQLSSCRMTEQDGVSFELLDASAEDGPKVAREWKMLAHTGQVISRWWGRLVLDMDGAKYRQKLALLQDHRTDLPIGFSTKIQRTERGIEARGRMLANEDGDRAIAYSQQGFPWQASLMAVPMRIEELEPGATAEVNGMTVTGPLDIFREWEMRELTLTVLGADGNTTTEAFAANGGEIEVLQTMTKKLNQEPASEPDRATPVPASQGGTALLDTKDKGAGDAAAARELAERGRAEAILQAATKDQLHLARQLVKDGTPLVEALQKLNADLSQRLELAAKNLRENAQPLSGGNGSGGDGSGNHGRELEQLESGPEKWEQQWKVHAQVREEFRLPGMSEADAKKRFLASQKFAAKFLPGGDRLAVVGGERLGATETHLQPLTERGIRGDFFLGFEARENSWVADIATQYTTDAPLEDYPFLGQVPRLRKWEGPRQENELNRGKLTILNDDYEDTFNIAGKDWRRDKSGQMALRVSDMGEAAAELPLDLISALLNTGHTTALAWDGVALFGNHVWGKSGTVDNDLGTGDGLAGGAAPTSAQQATNLFLAITRLLSLKDDQGRPFNTNAKSFVVMIPTNMLAATEAALADQFTSAGVSNTLATALGRGAFRLRYVWNPRLTATDTFFLWRDDARVKPFIYQEEFIKPPYLLGMESEFYKQHNKVQIGAHCSGGAAPGKYELIVRCKTA